MQHHSRMKIDSEGFEFNNVERVTVEEHQGPSKRGFELL